MKGLEQVRRAVMERLEQAGVRALSKMDEAPATRPDAPVAAVAVVVSIIFPPGIC